MSLMWVFSGKERAAREEKLDLIQRKEEEKWKRRSLPSGQQEDGRGGFKAMQVVVESLGWCELGEEDLTPENSSKAVNRCIVDLSCREREGEVERPGVWGQGRPLVLQLDEGSLKLIEADTGLTLNSQLIHAIRVWGVGRDNGRDFAYVSRDRQTRKHLCHVFRCHSVQLPSPSLWELSSFLFALPLRSLNQEG
jgi:amyloid beta (A4) precursor protein-binding family B protein 2 (Fe65-like)